MCVNRKLSDGWMQAEFPQRQNTILGHLVVARLLSDQPHISGCRGQVEEWGGRSSIEVEAGVCG